MCSALTPLQICKILTLYTITDEFEERVSEAFISKVQAKLQERGESPVQQVKINKSCCNDSFIKKPKLLNIIEDLIVCNYNLKNTRTVSTKSSNTTSSTRNENFGNITFI